MCAKRKEILHPGNSAQGIPNYILNKGIMIDNY